MFFLWGGLESDSDTDVQPESLPVQQLLDEIKVELEKTGNEADISAAVIDHFKARFLSFCEAGTNSTIPLRQAIYDALMDLAVKGDQTCFFKDERLLALNINKKDIDQGLLFGLFDEESGLQGTLNNEDEALDFPPTFEPWRPDDTTDPDKTVPDPDPDKTVPDPDPDKMVPDPDPDKTVPSSDRKKESTSPVLFYPVLPLPDFKSNISSDKALDLAATARFKRKLNHHLIQFSDELKVKLETSAHKKKSLDIYKQICKHLTPLVKEPSKANLQDFKNWFDGMLLKQKESFKAIPWVWHDVIRPILVGFLGVIVTLVTVPVRLFIPSVSDYANSFFEKPIPPAFQILMDESETLFTRIEHDMPTMSAKAGA